MYVHVHTVYVQYEWRPIYVLLALWGRCNEWAMSSDVQSHSILHVHVYTMSPCVYAYSQVVCQTSYIYSVCVFLADEAALSLACLP